MMNLKIMSIGRFVGCTTGDRLMWSAVLSNATESNSNAKQRVKDVKTLSSILLLAVVGLGKFAA